MPRISDGFLYQWKVAADGRWEEARELSAAPSADEINLLINWITTAPQDIAVEPFFKNSDGTFCFFGVRIAKLDIQAKMRCLNEILSISRDGDRFDDVLNQMRRVLHATDLLADEPDFIEVGAQGFWKSYGYYKIWDKNIKPSPATVAELAEHAPQILKPFKTSMMLEYAWAAPFPSWIAMQISEKTGGLFQFSHDIYSDLVSGFRPKA